MKKQEKSIWYMGIENVKRCGVDISHLLTPENINEYRKCSQDIFYFAENYIKVVDRDNEGEPTSIKLRDYQKEMITEVLNNRFTITMMARRMGKTLIISIIILWFALFKKNFKALILANDMIKSQEIISDIKTMIIHIPLWMQDGIKEWNKTKIWFEGGSILEARATTENSGRGSGNDLLYVDELAFIEDRIMSAFMKSSFPSVLSNKNTKMIITSTPRGMNMFHKLYKDAENGKNVFRALFYPWYLHPLYDDEFKNNIISTYGELYFRQEFLCAFEGSSDTLIKGEILELLTYNDPIAEKVILKDEYILKIFEQPIQGMKYIASVDIGEGLGKDYSSINITKLEPNKWTQVATFYNCDIGFEEFPFVIDVVGRYYNNAFVIGENNKFPDVYINLVEKCDYENVYYHDDGRIGLMTTKATRPKVLKQLRLEFEKGRYILNDHDLLKELSVFSWTGKRYEAEPGKHDDMIMSLAMFMYLLSDAEKFEEYIFGNMKYMKNIHDMDTDRDMPIFLYDNGIKERRHLRSIF